MFAGAAYFPGINQVVDASFTFTQGISPSVCTLTIAPQANVISEGGTLQFAWLDNGNPVVQLQWPYCKIDSGSLERNERGEVWRLQILDRRWMWGWGAIYGRWNWRGDDGQIKDGTEKTPQELAKLCLDAIKESGYDIGALPNQARPEVEWDWEAPMEALANLCDLLGCRIVLGLDNTVRIVRTGVGADLPSDGILTGSASIDTPERPGGIACVTAPIRYQLDLELEAVGLETDLASYKNNSTNQNVTVAKEYRGTYRPIDDLSYKPSGGWDALDLPYFSAVRTEDLDGNDRNIERELAQRTVFRCYRVKCDSSNPLDIPTADTTITDRDLIQVSDIQAETKTVNGKEVQKDAIVYGIWFPNKNTLTNSVASLGPNLIGDAEYKRNWHLDAKHHMVVFADPVFRNTESGTPTKLTLGSATLRLRCACQILDKETYAPLRWVEMRDYGTDVPYRLLRHDEMIFGIIPYYTTSYSVSGWWSYPDKGDFEAECDYYIDAAEQEYQLSYPQTVTYAGIRAIALDGAIAQVTWNVGPQGATTVASRNTEELSYTIPYRERRAIEAQRRTPKELVVMRAQQKRAERQARTRS